MSERIVAAAIQTDAGTFSRPPPNRHHNVIRYVRELGYDGDVSGDRQGFVTDTNRFVGRREAWTIADAAGQIERLPGGVEGLLFSENVW